MITILIVEDDENLNALYQSVLKTAGFKILSANNGEEALTVLEEHHVDLIITDIMMPEMDGFELAKELRQSGFELPILVITAKESYEDKRKGFGIGVDDYMVKPIDVNEMVLRVEALLRRARIAHEKELAVGKTLLNQETYEVTKGEQVTELPQKEFLLLYKLLSYPNKIFTRQQLMEEIWGMDTDTLERTVDVHVKRLRDKFADSDDFEIITIRGLGYKAVQKT
ncbi:response regulator transcription factor [Enterococcus sp. HY326]|uniref:response regulator transcription factor n=1 Tax=Enterococcus sp. HY326 TaxID=2971265 RepID=UPI002240CD3E|nr:response regulator transcription factor [Enterococcus sp. HY326]